MMVRINRLDQLIGSNWIQKANPERPTVGRVLPTVGRELPAEALCGAEGRGRRGAEGAGAAPRAAHNLGDLS